MKIFSAILLLIGVLHSATLNSYSIGKLSSVSIASKVRERFKASGEPLFLIHDSKKGVSVGDFIKFSDKMVLIDAQVWQTLAAERALSNISDINVTSISGSSNSDEWYKKSAVMANQNSKKSYILGAEILKIFEESFSGLPKKENMIISFSGGRATLIVPDNLISSLSLQRVVKSVKSGQMIWTVTPPERTYRGEQFIWQAWAADPGEPSGSISYSYSGSLPNGVRWNSSSHAFEGKPTETGNFPVTVSARSEKQRVSLACTLSVHENSAPVWANAPDTIRISDTYTTYPILVSDYESPSYQLKVAVTHLPTGFKTADSLRNLTWNPGPAPKPVNDSVVISVSDPMGKVSNYSVPVNYDRDGVDIGYTFATLTPPWDTLVEGVTYRWNIKTEKRHWQKNHLEMHLGSCSDSASLEDSVITMKPNADSLFHLTFQFTDRGRDAAAYVLNLPVIKNRPPYFEAFPDKWDIEVFDLVYFEPKAADPEGENVSISLRSADSGFVWHDGRLSFSATAPGTYRAYFEAKDEYGNLSVQQVSYFVKQIYDRYRGFKVETGIWPGKNSWSPDSWGFMNSWRLNWDTPALRFGIFSPDDCNLFNSKAFQFPFFYVGTEILPPHKKAEGKSLVLDVGATYNQSGSRNQTFGMMVNLEGKAVIPQILNSQLDFRFLFFARYMLRKVIVDMTINENGKVERTNDINILKDYELLENFISTNNLNVFIGATQWFHIGSGFFIGPSYQFRTAPIAMTYTTTVDLQQIDSSRVIVDRSQGIFSSFVGFGLRQDLKVRRFEMENRLRSGWGGENYGWMTYWDLGIGFGRFRR